MKTINKTLIAIGIIVIIGLVYWIGYDNGFEVGYQTFGNQMIK